MKLLSLCQVEYIRSRRGKLKGSEKDWKKQPVTFLPLPRSPNTSNCRGRGRHFRFDQNDMSQKCFKKEKRKKKANELQIMLMEPIKQENYKTLFFTIFDRRG